MISSCSNRCKPNAYPPRGYAYTKSQPQIQSNPLQPQYAFTSPHNPPHLPPHRQPHPRHPQSNPNHTTHSLTFSVPRLYWGSALRWKKGRGNEPRDRRRPLRPAPRARLPAQSNTKLFKRRETRPHFRTVYLAPTPHRKFTRRTPIGTTMSSVLRTATGSISLFKSRDQAHLCRVRCVHAVEGLFPRLDTWADRIQASLMLRSSWGF
jgi:hypothetical protein